jgi:zinc protease
MSKLVRLSTALLLGLCGVSSVAFSSEPKTSSGSDSGIVSSATIAEQKKLTTVVRLKNGIPVIIREIPGSDIVQINVNIEGGMRDLPTGRKSLNRWLFSVMGMAAEGWPKSKVFAHTEKYALSIGCGGGIESSSCGLGTISAYWKDSLPLLAAIVQKPLLTEEDVGLQKQRLEAALKSVPQEPDGYVNEIVNTIYYPEGHPYRLNHDEALAEMAKMTRADLVSYHASLMNASLMNIVVVSSLAREQIVKDLEKAFGGIKSSAKSVVEVPSPVFDPKNSLKFQDRDIPTAYIRAKFVSPAVMDKDAVAARLLFEILNEELGDEIRTRRSLSYAVYAFQIQYTKGIGVMGATTSKPKETLEAMNEVLEKVKRTTYTSEQIAEYKNVFATSYFLTQETHASLAGAIGTAQGYFGSTDKLYDFPAELEKIDAATIKRLANDILVDMRFGVIYNRKGFQDKWVQRLIDDHRSKR